MKQFKEVASKYRKCDKGSNYQTWFCFTVVVTMYCQCLTGYITFVNCV